MVCPEILHPKNRPLELPILGLKLPKIAYFHFRLLWLLHLTLWYYWIYLNLFARIIWMLQISNILEILRASILKNLGKIGNRLRNFEQILLKFLVLGDLQCNCKGLSNLYESNYHSICHFDFIIFVSCYSTYITIRIF